MSTHAPLNGPVRFQIDGRTVEAPAGTYVLSAARAAGIPIPTLCDHPDLEPAGACRLCMVEVSHPDWKGWKGLMTSCLYPVAPGIQVSTGSEAVRQARRRVLSLLLARCPQVLLIKELAAEYGASSQGLTLQTDPDRCILCGLCTRVCETYVTSAITTTGRGVTKKVGTFFDQLPDDCVGCGACAQVCPTGHIPAERQADGFHIWDQTFAPRLCHVEPDRCVGCGACEEACPFKVPRVLLRPDGSLQATIPSQHCRGCGVCVGACPSGAIHQDEAPWRQVSPQPATENTQAVVFACSRANLSHKRLPPGVRLEVMPCVGSVTTPLLLNTLASGADGVLVLGRHQQTCRLNGAEDPAKARASRVGELLGLAGLGAGRVRFAVPEPGQAGPVAAVEDFVQSLQARGPAPLKHRAGQGLEITTEEGLEPALSLFHALVALPEVDLGGAGWIQARGLPLAEGGRVGLALGDVPALSLLAADVVRPAEPARLLEAGLAVLSALGLPAGLWAGSQSNGWKRPEVRTNAPEKVFTLCPGGSKRMLEAGIEAQHLDVLLRARGRELPRALGAPLVACDGSPEQVELLEALGYTPVVVGPDPLPQRFDLGPDARQAADDHLLAAERLGAVALLVNGPRPFVRWHLFARQGTWQKSRVQPVTGALLAWLALKQRPLTLRNLTHALMPAARGGR